MNEIKPKPRRQYGRPIEALDLATGEVVARFESAAAANRAGFHASALSLCLRGKIRQVLGYGWRYADAVAA